MLKPLVDKVELRVVPNHGGKIVSVHRRSLLQKRKKSENYSGHKMIRNTRLLCIYETTLCTFVPRKKPETFTLHRPRAMKVIY